MAKKNKFSRILHHIRSKEINEKLELLNEIPTNNTTGIYVVEPEATEIVDTIEDLEPDLTKDDQEDGRDTTGLFAPDGTILTDIPPGDNSYVLGPMMLIRYTYPSISYEIGYIGKENRRFTSLGRINYNGSNFSGWDGTSNFTSYGQLSLEQAQWFRERFVQNQVAQYRTFVNGPPPYFPYIAPGPDSFNRFLGWIIGIGRQIGSSIKNRIPPTMGGFDPNLLPGSANPQRTVVRGRRKGGLNVKTAYHGTSKTAEKGIKQTGFKPTKTGLRPNSVWVGSQKVAQGYARGGSSSGSMQKNAPNQQSVMKLRIPKGSGTTVPFGRFGPETAISKKTADVGAGLKPPRVSSGAKAGTTIKVTGVPSGGGGGGMIQPIEPWIGKTDPLQGYTWDNKSGKYKLANSHYVQGDLLSENKKRILREIKKPCLLPEEPKIKFKHKPKVRSVNSNMMKASEVPPEFKAHPNVWRKNELKKNEILSQQRKNDVLEMTGNSDWFWEYMTETSREKNKNIQYTNFEDESKKIKGKVIRKEELGGDYLVFIQDQKTNEKKTMLQSELNELLAQENAPKEFQKYFAEQETLKADKDPLFKKVSKRLKKEIDYSDKPSRNGFPNDPPPEMIGGWHPEYGKDKGYYNKIDPQSAKSMPPTGNSEIDNKVVKARKRVN